MKHHLLMLKLFVMAIMNPLRTHILRIPCNLKITVKSLHNRKLVVEISSLEHTHN